MCDKHSHNIKKRDKKRQNDAFAGEKKAPFNFFFILKLLISCPSSSYLTILCIRHQIKINLVSGKINTESTLFEPRGL